MKKVLMLTLVAALLLAFSGCGDTKPSSSGSGSSASAAATSSASAAASTPAAQKERIKVEAGQPLVDFEKGTEGMGFWDLSAYGFVSPDTTVVTGEEVYAGQGIKMDIAGDNTRGVMNLQMSELKEDIKGGMAKASDYEYLRFWVNNKGDADVSIAIITIISSSLKNGCLDPEGALLYDEFGNEVSGYPDNAAGVSTLKGNKNTSLSIPAGFTGWAYYPIKQQVPWWEGNTLSEQELKSVDTLTFDMRYVDATAAEALILDDVCLANAPK